MKKSIFFFLPILLSLNIFGQENKEAITHIEKGDAYAKELSFESAILHYQKALEIYKTLKENEKTLSAANKIGEIYNTTGKFDQAKAIVEKYLTKNIDDHSAEKATSLDILATATFRRGKFAEAQVLYEQALAVRQKAFDPKSLEVAESYNNLGKIYYMQNDFKKAKEYIELALEIRIKKLPPDDDDISSSYNNLGIIYGTFTDYDSSLMFFQKSLDIKLADLPADHPKLATTYFNIANMHFNMGNFNDAYDLYKKSLDIRYKQYGPNHHLVATSSASVGDCFFRKGIYDKSRDYYEKALSTYILTQGPDHVNVANVKAHLGNCYFKENNYNKAIENYREGARIYKMAMGEVHFDLTKFYSNIAKASYMLDHLDTALHYAFLSIEMLKSGVGDPFLFEDYIIIADVLAKKNEENALKYYHKAIQNAVNKMGRESVRNLEPLLATAIYHKNRSEFGKAEFYFHKAYELFRNDLTDVSQLSFNSYPNKRELLKFLLELGKLKEYKFEMTEDLKQLHQAHYLYNLGDHIIQELIRDFNNEGSNLAVPLLANNIYERSVVTAEKLYNATNDDRYVRRAFETAEKIKSVSLLFSLKESEARESRGINDPVLQEDNQIKVKLASLTQKIERAGKNNDSTLLNQLSSERFELFHKKDSIKAVIALKYPELYQSSFRKDAFTLKQIQSNLEKDQALIEYLLTSDKIYIFLVTTDGLTFFNIGKPDNFDQLVLTLRQQLSEPPVNNEALKQFIDNTKILSSILLNEPLKALPKRINNLVLCTDGKLGYIPFEILPVSGTEGTYLVENYNISYIYSAAVYLQLKQRKRSEGEKKVFAGFAPEYIEKGTEDLNTLVTYVINQDNLQPLPLAREEVHKIAKILDGDAYTGSSITEGAFKQKARNYKILHLAAHGFSDDASTLSSRIIFNEGSDTLNDGSLYANEIYELDLNADLVVLSACNSGYGGIRNGEGIMSLSRAFTYAGCPSTVMSLWKISDNASSEIMLSFYSHIKKGKAKDEALRLAKLDYLSTKEDPILRHPFYWAGFVPIGDMQPIFNSQKKTILVILEIFLFFSLIAAGIAIFRKRKRQSIT